MGEVDGYVSDYVAVAQDGDGVAEVDGVTVRLAVDDVIGVVVNLVHRDAVKDDGDVVRDVEDLLVLAEF